MAVVAGCDRHETPRTCGGRDNRPEVGTGPGGSRTYVKGPRERSPEEPGWAPVVDEDAWNSTLPAAFRHIRALSVPESEALKRDARIDHTMVWSIRASRSCVLPNTHGSVDFPRSPSRDASPVTFPWDSRASRVAQPPRIRHSPQTRPLGGGHSLPGPPPRGQRPLSGRQLPRP